MINKKVLSYIVILFLVGTIIAGTITIVNKEVEYEKDIKDALASINLTDWSYSDSNNENGLTSRCLIKEKVLNKCSPFMDEKSLDAWEKKEMNALGEAIINRSLADVTNVKTGITIVTEEK